jgi:hypothetical protein
MMPKKKATSSPNQNIDVLLKDLFGKESIEDVLRQKTENLEKVDRSRAIRVRGGKVKLDEETCRKLCRAAGIEYRDGYENRVVERVFTDETVDRYGDIVKADGVDFENFKKNPVALAFHNGRALPVGAVLRIWYDPAKKAVLGWILFFDTTVDATGMSETIFQYCISGALKAVSIGFLPKSQGDIYRPTDEERKLWKMPPYGVVYRKIELLEVSVVAVPANPNARDAFNIFTKEGLEQIKDVDLIDTEIALNVLINTIDEDDLHLEDEIPCCFGYKDTADFFAQTEDIAEDEMMRPYPNEHACRLNDPKKYERFRRGTRKSNGKTYSIVFGKLKGENRWEEQAYRYDKKIWTAAQARAHCKEHEGTFEAATEEDIDVHHEILGIDLTLDTETKEQLNILINKLILVSDKLDALSSRIERQAQAIETLSCNLGGNKNVDGLSADDDELTEEQLNEIVSAVGKETGVGKANK